MNYNHIIKKQTFIITASIIVMAIILVGTSYALFTNTDTSNTQTLTSGTLVVSYSGTTITTVGGTDGNGNLLEVTPLDELTVNQQTPYTIKINNTGTLALKYNIILFTDSINTLPHSYYSYKYKDNGTYTNKAALSTLPKVDPTETNMNSIRYKLTDEPFIVNPGTEATHEIYVWVDAIAADGASEDKIASLKIMVEGEATDEYGDSGVSIVETVQNIVSGESTSSTDVIDQGNGNTLAYDGTNDNNLRYVGSNPANYVQYNNELWRIIGVMNNIETEGGATQSLVKIRRVESLGSYVWDSSYGPGTYWWGTTIGINNGYGVNQWGNSGSYAGAYLMQELNNIKHDVEPQEILLLVDAAAGQDAVNVANTFNDKLSLTGCIMSKLDGDARGGAALSIRHMTGVPIKFTGVGEKVTDLDIFHPDRMADRILGMGDVMTLVEKAQEEIDEKEAKRTMNKMMSGSFDLNDMLAQMKQINKLGSLGGIMKLIPGMPKITPEQQEAAEREMRNFEIVINSMTKEERKHPELFKYSRKQRVAQGSGKTMQDVNKVLKKYEQMKEMMKRMEQYKKSGRMPPGGMGGMGFPGM